LCRRGAPMKNLAHSASFDSDEKYAPSKSGIKQLVDPEATCTGNGTEPGADIDAYLTRHGARVSVDLLASAGKSAAAVLALHAVDTSADMIVMGACGNRRLRERLFGGVARWIVGKPPLPLFLAR
ncbi:universal stress protein, partial [Mesorhizobium sp. M0619]|uniref:universal stress protein n=1 Tax=unclassified Mesorhizobium TaxID=325217 RepID=UPI003339C288